MGCTSLPFGAKDKRALSQAPQSSLEGLCCSGHWSELLLSASLWP